jgi:hypothetical protein
MIFNKKTLEDTESIHKWKIFTEIYKFARTRTRTRTLSLRALGSWCVSILPRLPLAAGG